MPKFKLRHVLVCEEVRREVSGKDMLLGVFEDTIVVQSMPAVIDRLFFRIAIDCDPSYNDDYSFSVVSPDKQELIEGSGKALAPPEGNKNRLFGFAMRNFPAQLEGEYEIRFALNTKPKKIWSFTVRLPGNSLEQERLARAAF